MMPRRPALALLPALLALASCATLPPAQRPSEWLTALPPDSAVFAAADVRTARPLLEAAAGRVALPEGGLEARQLGRVLDRTDRLYAGLDLSGPGGPVFSLVALGRFRPGALACRLGAAADWERHGPGKLSGEPTYWQHRRVPLQMAVPRPGVVLLSNGVMQPLLLRLGQPKSEGTGPAASIPPEVDALLGRSALVAYLPSLALAEAAPSPVREAWFAASVDPAAPGGYLTEIVLRLEEERSPRALESLARLLLAAWLRRGGLEDPAGRLRAARITAQGREVRIAALPLDGDDLLALLETALPPRGR